MCNEIIKHFATSDNSLALALNYFCNKTRVKLDGGCLEQDKITYTHGTIVIMYIVYELSSIHNISDFALENCLFGVVKLTNNIDIDKYKYSGCGIGFDLRGTFFIS